MLEEFIFSMNQYVLGISTEIKTMIVNGVSPYFMTLMITLWISIVAISITTISGILDTYLEKIGVLKDKTLRKLLEPVRIISRSLTIGVVCRAILVLILFSKSNILASLSTEAHLFLTIITLLILKRQLSLESVALDK